MHERQSVFPTEVHEFNVANAGVKVDACGKDKKSVSVDADAEGKAVLSFQMSQKRILPAHLGLGHLLARSR